MYGSSESRYPHSISRQGKTSNYFSEPHTRLSHETATGICNLRCRTGDYVFMKRCHDCVVERWKLNAFYKLLESNIKVSSSHVYLRSYSEPNSFNQTLKCPPPDPLFEERGTYCIAAVCRSVGRSVHEPFPFIFFSAADAHTDRKLNIVYIIRDRVMVIECN